MSNAPSPALHSSVVSEPLPSTLQPGPAEILELSARQGSTVTPREINDQLARILQNYDELTAEYANNAARIEEEFERLRADRSGLSARLQSLHGEILLQNGALATLAGSTSADIETVKKELSDGMLDVEERTSIQVTALTQRVGQDVSRLDGGVLALGQLLEAQQSNIQRQSERLAQFDVVHELLDTATRGNRKRIEVVREELETQQTIVSAQVQGLAALQREHHGEFLTLRSEVGVITAQIRQLEFGQQLTNGRLEAHSQKTQIRFRWAFGGVALAVLLTFGGVAAVKWLPAFAPVETQATLARATIDLAEARKELAQLPAMEYRASTQEGQISQLSRTVAALKQNLGEMSERIGRADRALGLVPMGTLSVDGLAVFDGQWVRDQSPLHYTVQLAGTESQAQMMAVVNQHAEFFAPALLAYTVTQPQEQTRFNLFMGSYATQSEARAAIEGLPAGLQLNKPWVRQWQAVQSAAR
jgi:hypothetical protein